MRNRLRVIAFSCTVVACLILGPATVRGGTITGIAVDLNGTQLQDITVTVTGGGATVTNAVGAFTIATPNVRPVTLTLSGAGSQTVTLTNLDGTTVQTINVVVPKAEPVCCPCYVSYAPCYEMRRGCGIFRRH
jgi:hypothetical protein